MSVPAMRRGAIKYLKGFVDSVVKGVDLFGHPHGADFCGHCGANPAGHHQAAQTGASSRAMPIATTWATAPSALNRAVPSKI